MAGVGHDLGQVMEIELDSIFQVVLLQELLELLGLSFRQSLPEVHQKLADLLD